MIQVVNFTADQVKQYSLHFFKVSSYLITATVIAVIMILIPPSADLTRRVHEFGLEIALFLSVIFSVLLGRRGSFWAWVGLVFTLLLFAFSLIYKWQGLDNNYFLIGGLLPWSDSYGYYDEAQRLLHGLNLTVWGARRPFFPAFLSVILAIANNNLQFVLVIFVLLSALVVYLAVREIQTNLKSSTGAAAYLVISFLFYRRFAGTVMTENLGFLLGNLALVFLLRGARENSIKKLYWGLLILTIGLNARAGAFFVLPMLAIWIMYFLRWKLDWWRIFAGAVCVIFLGMASNLLLLKLIGPAEGAVPFSNFSYTFYGLASGNKGWTQVFKDYPNVKEEDVPDLAVQKFKENPYLFVIGITKAYQGFVTASQGSFSFLLIRSPEREFASALLWVLTIIGLILTVVERKRRPYLGIASACFLGILFSVSLLPPIDSDKMRVHAATIPITAYIISLGVSVPGLVYRTYINRQESKVENENTFPLQSFALPLSIALLCTLFVGPLLVKQSGHYPNVDLKFYCAPDNEQIQFLMGPGSSVSIESDAVVQEPYLPQLRISDFQRNSRGYEAELNRALLSLGHGSTINLGVGVNTLNSEQNIRSTFLVSSHVLKPGYYELCVTKSKSELLQVFPFYYDSYMSMPNGQSVSRFSESLIVKVRFWYSLGLWILFGLFVLDFVQIWKFPIRIVPLVLANTMFISIGLLALFHCLGLVPLQWQSIPLSVENAKHSKNFMYFLDLENHWMSATDIWSYPVKLYENGVELSSSDKNRSLIASEGAGKFTITDGILYFSSSDNTNPQKNGRQYKIMWPTPVRQRYQGVVYLLAAISLFIHLIYFRRYISIGQV